MATAPSRRATLDDLARVTEKAELVGGRVVLLMPTGRVPNRVAGRVYRALDDYARAAGRGEAYTDNIGFAVPALPSGRESFSPDASYYNGPFPADAMRFLQGPPTLAVEVRSAGDYGPAAERALAEKRADYFAAGTVVVWDVDPVAGVVRAYRAAGPSLPAEFRRGDRADAEPALPGWRLDLDAVFGPP